jgi:type IV pilus assembly protein PilC
MENYTYKGISGSKYVSGEIEALNLDEASHKLKQQKNYNHQYNKDSKKRGSQNKRKEKKLWIKFI